MNRRKDFRMALCVAVLLHAAAVLYAVRDVSLGSSGAAGPSSRQGEMSILVTLEEPVPVSAPEIAVPTPLPAPPAPPPVPPEPMPAVEDPPPVPAPAVSVDTAIQGPPVPDLSPPAQPAPAPSVSMATEQASPGFGREESAGPAPVPPAAAPAMEPGGKGGPPAWGRNVDIRPRYPLGSRRRGEEGLVRLQVRVIPSGHPDRIEVAESSGYSALDQAAVDAVRKTQFPPGTVPEGSGEVRLSFRFRLQDAPQP